MKMKRYLGLLGVSSALVVHGFAAQQSALRASVPAAPPASSAAAAEPAPAVPAPTTTAEILQKLAVPEPRYPAHPPSATKGERARDTVATPKVIMAAPPPAPRAETKPPAPAGNFVWVPGHYIPLKNEWRWVAGEWGVPATPSSVWIESSYDPKTKTWSPGYWQPDRPEPTEPSAPNQNAPAPNGYGPN